MGGGAAMRSAAKVAGIGVMNGGLRGKVPVVPPAEQSVRNASWPVSAIMSKASADVSSSSVQQAPIAATAPWNDWEFADEVQELVVESEKSMMPRVVFDKVPSFEEAKEATIDLKDALDKVYLSSPKSTGGDSFADSQVPGLSLSLLSSPEIETKSSIIEATPTSLPPKHVLHAFKLLSGSPEAQSVVASIASDPNVWSAVLDNPVFKDFVVSNQRDAVFEDQESVADAESQDQESPKKFEEKSDASETGNSENGAMDFMDMMQNIKLKVLDMVSNVSNYFQNIFGSSASKSMSDEANGNAKASVMETLGPSLMGLAMMVIMVVVMKRV